MDISVFNDFATTWQNLVSTVKLSFASKNVSATHGFKQSYKLRTGKEFSMTNTDLAQAPIAVEPMKSRCRTAAVGCYIVMPSGHVYEGVIRVGVASGKELVHLVWFCASDAKKRPLLQLDNGLFKEGKCTANEQSTKKPPKESEGDMTAKDG